MRALTTVLLVGALAIAGCTRQTNVRPERLRLATTTSTRDSGLLDHLLPTFEEQVAAEVQVIAVGTGKALKLGEAGDVDVVFVHARAAEDAFMAAGHGSRREDVMYNRFEIVGPPKDPAGIRGKDPVEALRIIARTGSSFVSRGDDSGTHKKELSLWTAAGGLEPWEGYLETGQGMGMSLMVAFQKRVYTLVDRGTFLAFRDKIDLVPLSVPAEIMNNPYGVMVVNPAEHAGINSSGAHALVDFFISPAVQASIAAFRVGGEQLFHPMPAGGE